MNDKKLTIGHKYHFPSGVNLIYLGARRYENDDRPWHQFAQESNPTCLWCEMLSEDLPKLTESEE